MTTQADNAPAATPQRRTFGDVLDEIRADATSEAAKGAAFERLVKAFFQQDALYARTFSNVWLWSEWPGNRGRGDTGVDIVAELRSGAGYSAIQCKFYDPNAYIDKAEIDSFMTESGREGFVERIIVTTTSNWSRNALDALHGQQIPALRIGPQDFDLSSIDWAAFRLDEPQTMARKEPKRTRPHQQEAMDDVIAGFEANDRGKLIMACGTGKTYTALRIAERQVPPGGTILFLTPSLQLVSQSLRDWANDMAAPMRFFAVCSDTTVGKTASRRADEDEAEIEAFEMVIPATTSAEKLLANWPQRSGGDAADAEIEPRNVVFSTYQSLDVVIRAQQAGLGDIDLVVCDEAHRTTGVTLANADESEFTKVHSDGNIRAKKRLYMTATPRIFSEKSKGKARDADATLASMDDESVFGPEFHRLEFGKAVERELLCDYRVIIFGVSEKAVASDMQAALSSGEGNLNLTDMAKIVASWNALSKQKSEYEDFAGDPEPMRRVVAFAGRIQQSKDFAAAFNGAVSEYKERNGIHDGLAYASRHVDGTMNSMRRAEDLQWLAADAEGECRILSNARCLTEGVDVPDLDGALFLSPRRSVVDVVQAVGRAMRKADGKKFGYIVIPIAVAPDGDYRKAILDSAYNPTWQVLQALKAHDESFYDSLNQTDLRLRSVEDVLRAEFGASLAGEGVHILDPFVGTGTFIARLLSGGFAGERENLARKYAGELYANEIVLLAYYVAAANIEAAYRDAAGAPDYAPFPGVALADTFQLAEYRNRPTLSNAFIQGNSERIDRQTAADIRVIIGNPPWSIGQRSANDENKNREYPALRARVSETYNKNSSAGKNNLDTYVQAIRWASDRISESERGGVVAFITNGGFIDSIGGDGLRKSLMQEFHKVYCLDLRGDQRTAGEKSRQEGGKLFGAGSRASVAVLICIKKPDAANGAALLYRDVGDYLTREDKLAYLAGNRLADLQWETIVPNAVGDWINQRSDEFPTLFPLAGEGGVFVNSSSGAKTNLDPWCWNFSRPEVGRNVSEAMRFFNEQPDVANPAIDPGKLNWTTELRRELARGVKLPYSDRSLTDGIYRPFTRQSLYLQSRLVNRPGKMMEFYPTAPKTSASLASRRTASSITQCSAP